VISQYPAGRITRRETPWALGEAELAVHFVQDRTFLLGYTTVGDDEKGEVL
jgi:hypothetical protein